MTRVQVLNKGVFVSVGGRQPGGVTYETYLIPRWPGWRETPRLPRARARRAVVRALERAHGDGELERLDELRAREVRHRVPVGGGVTRRYGGKGPLDVYAEIRAARKAAGRVRA